MADESIVSYGIIHDGVYKIVGLHLKRLCVDVSSLDDSSLCFFVYYMTDETKFHIPIDQIMRHVTNGNISDQIKIKVELNPKEGVTLLMELTGESDKFNETREITRRACLRGISTETFCGVAKHPEKY